MAKKKRKTFRVFAEPPKGVKVSLPTRDGEARSAVRVYELQANSPQHAKDIIAEHERKILMQPHEVAVGEVRAANPGLPDDQLDLPEIPSLSKAWQPVRAETV